MRAISPLTLRDGAPHAFAAVARLLAVAQFEGFALARRCTRWDCGASQRAIR